MNIGMIGTGVFSVATAMKLTESRENKIELWSENKDLVKDFKKTKKLNTIFLDKDIPIGINVTNSLKEVVENKDIVFLMTSIIYLESVVKDLKDIIDVNIPIVIGTKGINENNLFAFQIVKKYLKNKILVMGGPTLAIDMTTNELIGFTIASKNKKTRNLVKKAFLNSNVIIEDSKDLMGVSLSGVLKNIYAISMGMLDGMKVSESTKALYITKIYQEFTNILYHFYGLEETLSSLAGIGDLFLTCTSKTSRNFNYGVLLGKKTDDKKINEYQVNNTIEGLNSINHLCNLLENKKIKAPIVLAIRSIIINKNIEDLLNIIY